MTGLCLVLATASHPLAEVGVHLWMVGGRRPAARCLPLLDPGDGQGVPG